MKYITESFIDFTPWHLYSCFRGDAACLGNGFRGGFPRRQKMEMKIKSRPATSSNLNLPRGLSTKQRIFSICSIFLLMMIVSQTPSWPPGEYCIEHSLMIMVFCRISFCIHIPMLPNIQIDKLELCASTNVNEFSGIFATATKRWRKFSVFLILAFKI